MKSTFAPPFQGGEPRATSLLDDGFRRRGAWRDEARARSTQGTSPLLIDALAGQRPLSPAQRRSLDALAERGTVAVVTGQQIGLFLGPLYTFYKAASAISWARAIEAETGVRCVPIFWLQTEDHDFAEIASCVLPGVPEPLALPAWPGAQTRTSVAYAKVPREIEALLARLEAALATLPHAAETLLLVREAWQPGRSLAEAFAAMLASLFGDEGLLILDPRCAVVARLSAPLYQAAVERQQAIESALAERSAALSRAELLEQVHLRPGSPLVFFHGQAPEGPRHRLQRQESGGFLLDGGGEISREALIAAARSDPLLFSSSALLRPLVQDSILPVVAYVGGPAELGYLAQAAPLYPLLGVRPALAVPRSRFRLVDARAAALLQSLQLAPCDLETARDSLLARLGAARVGSASPGDLARSLLGELPPALAASARKHPALEKAARRTRLSVERAVSRFANRHARLLAAEDTTLAARIDKLQAALFPAGAPQERVHSLPWYAARHGIAALKAAVQGAIQPGHPQLGAVQDLSP